MTPIFNPAALGLASSKLILWDASDPGTFKSSNLVYSTTGANLTATATAANVTALVAKGTTSQTAAVFEVQDATGDPAFKVSATQAIVPVDKGIFFAGTSGNAAFLNMDSGSNFACRANTSGGCYFGNLGNGQTYYQTAGANRVQITANGAVVFNPEGSTGASVVQVTVKGAAAQSANLQEWQNSSGTPLAAVTSAGYIGVGRTDPAALIHAHLKADELNHTPMMRLSHAKADGTDEAYLSVDAYRDTGGNKLIEFSPVNTTRVSWNNAGQFIFYDGGGVQPLFYQGIKGAFHSNFDLVADAHTSGGAEVGVRLIHNSASPRTVLFAAESNRVGINTETPVGALHVMANSSTRIGAIIQGAAAQTANLLQLKDSAGGVLVGFDADNANLHYAGSPRIYAQGDTVYLTIGAASVFGTNDCFFQASTGGLGWAAFECAAGVGTALSTFGDLPIAMCPNRVERFRFTSSGMTVGDGMNVVLNATTGTKFGTSSSQKMAWWNATPVAQQVLATGAGATVDNVISMLQTLGLCRQS